jgi:hypothetical protein
MTQFSRIKISNFSSAMAICLCVLSGCGKAVEDYDDSPIRGFEDQVGTRFSRVDSLSFTTPDIREVPLNFSAGGNAIWGAIGRDDRGNLYLGVSTHSGKESTAFLYQYDPKSSVFLPQGDVLAQLKRLGLYKPGMGQNKLHSKFYQADDNYIYFTSFDEQGEGTGINPTWGGHLWRKKDTDTDWQHLLATKEALIAVNLAGKFVYALGYWNHVLYQFNTQNQQAKRVVVGSVAKHVSRNFLVDPQGHAYVPKVKTNPAGEVRAFLNEYDTHLNLLGSYPMPSYRGEKMSGHHGIVGYSSMASGNIMFTTSDGGLYELNVWSTAADKLAYRGMMHPQGSAYIPSLFPLDGNNLMAGVGRAPGNKGYEWLVYELQTKYTATYKLDTGNIGRSLLYGTSTKDDEGNFYLVGRSKNKDGKGSRPVLLVIPAKSVWSLQQSSTD